jgi:hypothetical protein
MTTVFPGTSLNSWGCAAKTFKSVLLFQIFHPVSSRSFTKPNNDEEIYISDYCFKALYSRLKLQSHKNCRLVFLGILCVFLNPFGSCSVTTEPNNIQFLCAVTRSLMGVSLMKALFLGLHLTTWSRQALPDCWRQPPFIVRRARLRGRLRGNFLVTSKPIGTYPVTIRVLCSNMRLQLIRFDSHLWTNQPNAVTSFSQILWSLRESINSPLFIKSTVHCRAHEARTPPLDLSSVHIPTQDTRGVSSLQVSRSTLCAHLILPQCKASPVRRSKHLERSDGLSIFYLKRSLHSASLITSQWPTAGREQGWSCFVREARPVSLLSRPEVPGLLCSSSGKVHYHCYRHAFGFQKQSLRYNIMRLCTVITQTSVCPICCNVH